MEILRDLSIFWAMFHVIFVFIMLFRSRYAKKKTLLLAGSGMGLLMVANGVALIWFGIDVLGKIFLFTCSVPSFILFYVMSADKRFRFLLTFCLADTSCLWIMAVTNLLDFYLGGGQYVIMFISRLVAYPIMEYCVYRFLRKPYLELQDAVEKGWGIFAGMTIIYYILLVVVVQYPVNIIYRPEDTLLCILVLVLMVFNYGTIFSSLYRQLLLYQKQQSEHTLREEKNMLEARLENQEKIRRMKHDMKGHAITLWGLLAAGKTQESLKYLEGVKSEMEMLSEQFCANPYINAIFTHYSQKLKELQAEFLLDIQVGDEELPYMELCQILANGLENVCDMLKKLTPDKREASVQMKYNRDYLIIRIRNRCTENLSIKKGEIPTTSKKEKGHGFGLRTIQEASKKLSGDMVCYTEKENFVLDVMMQVKQPL